MSNFLAVDTSSRYLTVVAVKGEKVVTRHTPDCAMNHSVVLMDEIDLALRQAELEIGDCDFLAAVTGPGSFTGIRIGVSCIKGFSSALGVRAVGVTAFEMLSYNVNDGNINGAVPYLVAIDALHGNYYVCGYDGSGREDIPPAYMSAEKIASLARPVYGHEELSLPDYRRINPAECLYRAALKCNERGGALSALYVKKSQAEEERASRLGVK